MMQVCRLFGWCRGGRATHPRRPPVHASAIRPGLSRPTNSGSPRDDECCSRTHLGEDAARVVVGLDAPPLTLRKHGPKRPWACGTGHPRLETRWKGIRVTAFISTAVIGIGNEFRRDDGVGPAVVALLRERAIAQPLPPGTVLQECDGDPGRLIGLWEGTGLTVVIDACFPSPVRLGRIHRWCPDPGSVGALTPGRHSTHGLGLVETVRLAHSLGRCPGRLVVYAVEGASQSLGTGLTPPVARVVRPLAERIEADVIWHTSAAPHDSPSAASEAGTRRDTPDCVKP